MSAKTQRHPFTYHMLGIDMSRAFDTINRQRLLEVMDGVVGPDERKLLRLLLERTTLVVRVGQATSESFSNTVGTPQGDGLSPVLFTCYLEAALRDVLSHLPPRPESDRLLPHESRYADDVNYYSTSLDWLRAALPIIAKVLESWSLYVNTQKTEWVTVSSTTENWKTVKQLGSLMATNEDIQRRKQWATIAFKNMYTLWLRREHVSEARRVRLYNAYVLPTLLYNCCTWGSTKAVSDKLDVFHRQQLRSLLGIHYPNRITNIELYRRCQSQPISEEVHRRRMTMLGHVLRLPEDTPPQQAMALYFNPPNTAKPGRPLTTLVTQIQQDCVHRQTPLKRSPHLQSLRQKASDRQVWKAFVKNAQ
ncbi:uncharacterized protein LOC135824262 [Sycon ciliatum]|uniref:uncharacterized protein LOC135824262 n=1 Tax=Sycon ciliatum TaxID=27933 RepID=UPI0031F6EA2C